MSKQTIWYDGVMRTQSRMRNEGNCSIFEYRIDDGDWIEVSRMVWPAPNAEPKVSMLQRIRGIFTWR